MAIRLQPLEIDIPEDDPFKNDLLSRKDSAEVLTHLVGSIEGPCVLAVDATWGAGKTTFLKLWAQHLRNQEFRVIQFNAWETDHSGDPFVALSSELTEGLGKHLGKADHKIRKVKKATLEVLRHAVPGAIRLATAGVLDLGPLVEKEIGRSLASYASNRLARHAAAQKSIDEFKKVLQDTASSLSQSTDGKDGKPLIVMIDELDRCRPTYAVELLEVAKHLFSVTGVIFVLAINRSELTHSIKVLYGKRFNAVGYLQRFFDADFRLPEPDRNAFINDLFHSIQIDVHLQRTRDQDAPAEPAVVLDLLKGFFGASSVNLREIAQAIHRLGLVLASLGSDQRWLFKTMTVALILRTLDFALYLRFVRGEASDLEVVENVSKRLGRQVLRQKSHGAVFESTLIIGFIELTSGESGLVPGCESLGSPLLEKYQNVVKAHGKSGHGQGGGDRSRVRSVDEERKHAREVSLMVENCLLERQGVEMPVGFASAVERLDLFSRELIDDARGTTSHE